MISIDPIISIVTYIEIFSSRNASIAETEQLRSFAGMAEIIQTDFNIAQRAIDIRLKYNTKFGDPVIAGTALDRNLIPIKRNTKDFANISGLKIINPYTI
jgi:predicted nucleic acid-binding protein